MRRLRLQRLALVDRLKADFHPDQADIADFGTSAFENSQLCSLHIHVNVVDALDLLVSAKLLQTHGRDGDLLLELDPLQVLGQFTRRQ